MLVVAVISVDAYLFLAFSDLTCHLEVTKIVGVFWFTVPPNSKETKFRSSHQEPSPSAGKNTGAVLMPCCAWKCVPTATSGVADISEVPGCHLL